MNSEQSVCKNCQSSFLIEPDDFTFYEKIGVLAPTLCPECRFQRRSLFRNERDYYKRKCDLCGVSIVAVYPLEFSTPVFCVKCWWSDKWNPADYGRDYNPDRPFLDQFQELFYEVPMLAMQNDNGIGSVNCEYTYDVAFSKNCYLVQCDWETENGMYSFHIAQCKDLVDSYYANSCNLSYELVTSNDCYGCAYLTLSVACNNCILGFDLRGCSDCIMCVGLRNKKYCILNEQYTKEGYEQKKKEMQIDRRDKLKEYQKQLTEFSLKFPRRYAHIFKSLATTGDVLYNCKASKDCFYFKELENCRYMIGGDGGKDTYDCNNTGRPTLCYESVTPDNSYRNLGTIFCWKCTQAEYSNNCHSCQYVLGCSGVKQGEYMILNKKYTKEDYEALRAKIKIQMTNAGVWGEFFPPSMSPHAYNESPAQDWMPLTKEQALAKDFRWKEPQKKEYQITMPAVAIPQTISLATDAILNETLGCAHGGTCEHKCSTAFKLISAEWAFYRKMNLPVPDLCHNCRYYERLVRRNPAKLYHRSCMCELGHAHHSGAKCPNEFETSYSPERPEIVYCESCYQAEIS
ncbi:MAG: hypothetical protein AAB483_04160 [Patescibacteria group bacterium]